MGGQLLPGADGLLRVAPHLPVEAFKTYQIASPADRMVKAACEQVDCDAWRDGWETAVDEATDLGRRQAAYIREMSGRTFREMRSAAGLTVFRFEPGQRCFREHHTRGEWFFERGGDWRGATSERIQHSPAGWVNSFGEHQERLAGQIERG